MGERIKVARATVGTLHAYGQGGDFSCMIVAWTVADAKAAHAALEQFLAERFEVVADPHNPPEVSQ